MKKVAVILSEYLIGKGVKSLLSQDTDLIVTSIPYNGDEEDGVIQHIESHEPSVVIIDESLLHENLGNLLFSQLLDFPKLRVLVLSVRDNRVNIYNREEVHVSHSADLISAIKEN